MKLILGSGSPRRKELLHAAGFIFEVRTKDTNESFPDDLPCTKVAEFVARKKLDALLEDASADELILCADTTVVVDNAILNKPRDAEDASEMLGLLSGRSHKVITGVCIASKSSISSFSVVTTVYFKHLSVEDIDFYIKQFKPFDKAGAYGIQEWIGHVAIERIEGSYNNVVGLPTHEVHQALKSLM
jgi:septum formation protein